MTNIAELKNAIALLEKLTGEGDPPASPQNIGKIGRKVIVRSRDAGVIYGVYAGGDASAIHISDAVQMWKWEAAQGISLIDVAEFGVKKAGCKFSKAKASVCVFNACALIDVSEDAASSIEGV